MKDLADNFIVQLVVSDCDAWWARHDPAAVSVRFDTRLQLPEVSLALDHADASLGRDQLR